MNDGSPDDVERVQRIHKHHVWITIGLIILFSFAYGQLWPMPTGTSLEYYPDIVSPSSVEFLTDITYTQDGRVSIDQEIFPRMFELIEGANELIVMDMFLFERDFSGSDSIDVAWQLTNVLLQKKQINPDIDIVLITDPINTVYGSTWPDHFAQLEQAGVEIVVTRVSRLRDSNFLYSTFYRILLGGFGVGHVGWMDNHFGDPAQKVTLRSNLRLLNFKANHRKTLTVDTPTGLASVVGSANPHSPSGKHSNTAFVVHGGTAVRVLHSEIAVADFSGSDVFDSIPILNNTERLHSFPDTQGGVDVRLLTENKIRHRLLDDIWETTDESEIDIAMFYLSDRHVVQALDAAAKRGVQIRLLLDPNKDAFGKEKNGIPNRQVAFELMSKGYPNLQVRWYATSGEQFHTKLVIIRNKQETIMYAGSANLTRRNLANYNLESELRFVTDGTDPLSKQVSDYFERLFTNSDALYSQPYEAFEERSWLKWTVYWLQEVTGLSTF